MVQWVTVAVALVTLLICAIASKIYYDYYEEELHNEINTNVDHSTQNFLLVIGHVESAMRTAVEYTQKIAADETNIDSILVETLKGFWYADEISIIYCDTNNSATSYSHECAAFYDSKGKIHFRKRDIDVDHDENWEESFNKGIHFWSTPYYSDFGETNVICYSAPLKSADGKPYAILCASIQLKWIAPVIVKYKASKDIDVSIYSSDGQCIVPRADEISSMDSDDLITLSRKINKTNWKIVFNVPKTYIYDKVNKVLLIIALLAALLLVGVIIAIILSVIKVARPFIRAQQVLVERDAKLEREMEIAAQTQLDIVPHMFPPFPERDDIDIFAMLRPAMVVGGDLYDYYIDDEKLHFCIGDVSGKGMPASLFMSATRYLFRSQTNKDADIASAVTNINRSLCTDNVNCTFVTFFYGCLDLKTGVLSYCNAGHNPPIIHNAASGDVRFLDEEESGMPLGIFDEADYITSTLKMSPGDTLLLYTDGVTEAMDSSRNELGNAATLECFGLNAHHDAKTIITAIRQLITDHAAGALQSDDITMLCIRIR